MNRIIFFSLIFFFNTTYSQSNTDLTLVLKNYLFKCYNDPNLISSGNYLTFSKEIYPVTNDYFLYIQNKISDNELRRNDISKFLNIQLLNVKINTNRLFSLLVNTRKFDTSYNTIKYKNNRCIGGIIFKGIFLKAHQKNHLYLLLIKFNSKYPNRQAEYIIEYQLYKGKWKFISEQMLSIT